MTRSTHVVAPSRAVTLLVAGAFAVSGACALAAQSASATPGDPHRVWVCKYVHKPGEAEVLKGGKNPIQVDEASLTNDRGVEPQLGDAFSDGQFRSVVVSLDAQAPTEACPAVVAVDPANEVEAPSDPLTTASPTGTTGTPTATATSTVSTPGAATPSPVTPTVDAVQESTSVPTVAFAAVPALGDAAPDTGGLGHLSEDSSSADVFAGIVLLAMAGGLVAAETRRRRRSTAEVD
ncbi:hypothetical protein [Terrabacter sp. MAHUQ-38]|uniref:hypothetical protein n=1 Tax=unclassified Terrabacter TaxID=2630222 RepID=UPI00165E0D3F|nr:hypothetical protein [Terrabacter sp. MAHUQ-38]MBC9820076.1 hypothetical protein [Terrabacter sp. MAHUQ-38]